MPNSVSDGMQTFQPGELIIVKFNFTGCYIEYESHFDAFIKFKVPAGAVGLVVDGPYEYKDIRWHEYKYKILVNGKVVVFAAYNLEKL